MFKCDYHTHSLFSFDGDGTSSPDALCRAAIEKGITDLAITDHFESNWRIDNLSAEYPARDAFEAITAAKDRYKDKLNLLYGIEIGQANQCPEEACRLLKEYKFDFVIASIHNLRSLPDFYFYDFSSVDDSNLADLFERNICELMESVDVLDKIDTIGHLTYIERYLAFAGKKYDFSKHENSMEKLFRKMIAKEIALELNVSTLCKGLGFSMPNTDILSFYRDCGGRLITVGSDSHSPKDVGESVEEGFRILKKVGLNHVLAIRNGQKTEIKI